MIIITAFGTIRNAVEATKLGAYAYLEKPVDNEELLLMIARALEVHRLEAEVEELKIELHDRYSFASIVGTSGRMNSVFQMMDRIARVDGTVLITGESGTGKELVARAIHFAGPRNDGPFVVVNCGAIPRDLIESEFFGHSKGAFTDARPRRRASSSWPTRGRSSSTRSASCRWTPRSSCCGRSGSGRSSRSAGRGPSRSTSG